MNRYQNIPVIKINQKPVYRTVKYPEIPLDENDIYVTTVQGDRFDVLASQYFQDETLWWESHERVYEVDVHCEYVELWSM
jgi:hypothetical protein